MFSEWYSMVWTKWICTHLVSESGPNQLKKKWRLHKAKKKKDACSRKVAWFHLMSVVKGLSLAHNIISILLNVWCLCLGVREKHQDWESLLEKSLAESCSAPANLLEGVNNKNTTQTC